MVKILGEGVGLIPGQGAKISHAVQYYKKKPPESIKKKKKKRRPTNIFKM